MWCTSFWYVTDIYWSFRRREFVSNEDIIGVVLPWERVCVCESVPIGAKARMRVCIPLCVCVCANTFHFKYIWITFLLYFFHFYIYHADKRNVWWFKLYTSNCTRAYPFCGDEDMCIMEINVCFCICAADVVFLKYLKSILQWLLSILLHNQSGKFLNRFKK